MAEDKPPTKPVSWLRRFYLWRIASPRRGRLMLAVYVAFCALIALGLRFYEKSSLEGWYRRSHDLVFAPLLILKRMLKEHLPQMMHKLPFYDWQILGGLAFALLLPTLVFSWKGRWKYMLLQGILIVAVWLVGAVAYVRRWYHLPTALERVNLRLWALCGVKVDSPVFYQTAWIIDADVRYVAKLKPLQSLTLSDTKVGDEGLQNLKRLTQLQVLGLENTKVTKAGVEELQKALPKCRISSNPEE